SIIRASRGTSGRVSFSSEPLVLSPDRIAAKDSITLDTSLIIHPRSGTDMGCAIGKMNTSFAPALLNEASATDMKRSVHIKTVTAAALEIVLAAWTLQVVQVPQSPTPTIAMSKDSPLSISR